MLPKLYCIMSSFVSVGFYYYRPQKNKRITIFSFEVQFWLMSRRCFFVQFEMVQSF